MKGVIGRTAEAMIRELESPVASKLHRRIVEGIPPSLVFSAPLVNIRSAVALSVKPIERYRLENEILGQQMIRWGVGNADVVYGAYGSGLQFWRYAKAKGLKVAIDMFGSALYDRIKTREHEAFPDWEDAPTETDSDRAFKIQVARETIELADLLLCPSPNVLDDLKVFVGELSPPMRASPRAVVVRYGIPSGTNLAHAAQTAPVPNRVLFAGGAVLLKGIHYLANAARSLSCSQQPYEFRIAGQVSDRVRKHPAAHALTFLGHLSRERMREEYARADVFVLPTLSEGSAAVVFEALAVGLPIVTTRSAGSVVTHGKEGLIVPERDSVALALAIEQIVQDRNLRNAMAQAAMATAADFSEDRWADRLVEVLATLTPETLPSRPLTAMPPPRSPIDFANS